jgi:hypothetical protein
MKIITFLFLISSSIWAQSYYMNIKTSSGTYSYSIQDIQKLTFDIPDNVEDYKKFEQVLKTFTLLQNYPNPFNPSTTIEFHIPYSSQVEVNIYDINGQLINRLMNEFLTEGNHKTIWNSKNGQGQTVASGAYIYQVKFDNKIISKKMLFIK